MTSTIPDFHLGDELLMETIFYEDSVYIECMKAIDEMYRLTDEELYLSEKVEDKNKHFKKTTKNALKNTMSTMSHAAAATGNIIDAEAGIMKTTWNLLMRAIELITKMLAFITGKILEIPQALEKLLRNILNIPEKVRAKIAGDIQIYIRAEDIATFYTSGLFARMDRYMSYADVLSQGDMWGTFFHKRKTGMFKIKEDDLRTCRRMEKTYEKIKNIDFYQTSVSMSDTNNVNLYFGNYKNIKFKDLTGQEFAGNYCEALKKLMDDTKAMKEKFKNIEKALGDKYIDTRDVKGTFGQLNTHDQQIVQKSITNTSKVVAIISKLVKYVLADMKVLNKAVDVINVGKKKKKSMKKLFD